MTATFLSKEKENEKSLLVKLASATYLLFGQNQSSLSGFHVMKCS
jgi:hypothetical protein